MKNDKLDSRLSLAETTLERALQRLTECKLLIEPNDLSKLTDLNQRITDVLHDLGFWRKNR